MIARAFLAALEALEAGTIADLLTDEVVEVLPFAASGGTEPAAVFTGKAAVMEVQETIVGAFSVVAFADVQVTESADAQAVFVEATSHRVQAGTERVYDNRYVLKLDLHDGLVRRITEYSNPVAFATFFDQPIG